MAKRRIKQTSAAAAARWAGKSPEERAQYMRELAAKRPKLTQDDLDLLAWLREHRPVLGAIVDSYRQYAETDLAPDSPLESASPDPEPADIAETLAPPAAPERPVLDHCSVCLGPIYDLDAPCQTCIQAGRLTPNASPDDLHAAQANAATPYTQAPTVYDAPRISNATTRAPIPAPAPPLRPYTASETCRSCGRLPELHISHGGPIGHPFDPQPAPVD